MYYCSCEIENTICDWEVYIRWDLNMTLCFQQIDPSQTVVGLSAILYGFEVFAIGASKATLQVMVVWSVFK